MAIDAFSIIGKISVDYSEASSGLSSVRDSAKDTAESLEDVDSAAEDAGGSVEDAGNSAENADGKFSTWKMTLSNLASQAISSLISKCTELAGNIIELGTGTETSFAQLETIAGAENIDSLKASISDLAKETGVSSSDLATVAYNAISAGASAEEAMDMVSSATKLGVAGFTDADSALSVLSTAMNSYGDAAGTAAEISDSLIQVQNLGVTTIGELSSSMGKAIATGSAYSVNLGNLESAYVSITKAGISTEEATTYLNSMMNELGDSGSDVSAILQEQTGQSFTQLMEDGYSLGDVLGILYDACDGDSTALMNLWGSAETGKASNAIVNQGLTEFNENLETITGSSGATEDAYSTMADTMETKINIMKTNFEELGLKIYEKFEEPLSSAITFVTDKAIPKIEELIENFDSYAPVIAGVTVAIVAFKAAMAISGIINAATSAFQAYQTANEGATVAQWLMNAAMSANPIVIVVALLAGLVAAIVVLWNTNEDFRNAVIGIWDAIKSAFSTAFEAIGGFFEKLGSTAQAVFEGMWTTIKTVINNILGGVETMANGVVDGINVLLDGIEAIANAAGSLLGFEPINISLSSVSLPRLAKGGVLEQGQIGLLEGDGAEAVVPLEQNREWIQKVVQEFQVQGMNTETTDNSGIMELLEILVRWLVTDGNFKDMLIDILVNYLKFEFDNREIGRLVRKYA
ncbi:MAG: phage tail tape measure protein [Lachnospiraceae bacterium]|nr:phage tail tape measure protein [Lachnospiraceae bacterium]